MHDSIAALVKQEGWRAEGAAARVHYEGGGGDRFAVEFYATAEVVLYWTVPSGVGGGDGDGDRDGGGGREGGGEGEKERDKRDRDPPDKNENTTMNTNEATTAAPIARETIPNPLRRRIRDDLAAAGVDPAIERRPV